MNLQKMMTKAKQRLLEAQERAARALLMWLEKEPSQDRSLSASASVEVYGPYIRYYARGKRRGAEQDMAIRNRTRRATQRCR